jgi:hypothetical protein
VHAGFGKRPGKTEQPQRLSPRPGPTFTDGDLDKLVSVLDPGVVLRGDFAPGAAVFRAEGAASVAKLARSYAGPEREVRAATINGAAGAVIFVAGQPTAIMAFLIRGGRVAAIDVLADPQRIARIDLSAATG